MALLVQLDCLCCYWLLLSMFTLLSVNSQVAPHSVKLNCTTNNDATRNSGRLTIGAAFPIYAELKCKNGVFKKNSTENSAFTFFDFIHGTNKLRQGSNASVCIMEEKDPNNGKYSAQLTIYREVRNTLLVYLSSRTILCTYRMYGVVSSNAIQLSPPQSLSDDMMQDIHMKSRRKLSLYVTDIKGSPIKTVLNLGKKVQLRGEIMDNNDGTDFIVENCWVYNKNNVYQFLYKGCGDGVIFPQTLGFISNYGTINSPFFEVFRLRGSTRFWFKCTVIFCDGFCPIKLCKLKKLTKISTNEARRKLIFKDSIVHGTTSDSRYSMQSEGFYVNDRSFPVSLPVIQSQMTNNSSVKLRLGNIYLLSAVCLIYYNIPLAINFSIKYQR